MELPSISDVGLGHIPQDVKAKVAQTPEKDPRKTDGGNDEKQEHVTLTYAFREHEDEYVEIRVTSFGEEHIDAAEEAEERLDELKEKLEE